MNDKSQNISLSSKDSIVINELKEYISNNEKFKKSNIFLELIRVVSKYSFYTSITFSILLFFAVYVLFEYNLEEIILPSYIEKPNIDIWGYLILGIAIHFAITSSLLLVREIFIEIMEYKYKGIFKNYIFIEEEKLVKIVNKLGELNVNLIEEASDIIRKEKYNNNNALYLMFTKGISKIVISKLFILELKSKIEKMKPL